MDFGINEEQRMIQDAAKRLMKQEIQPVLAKYPAGSTLPVDEIRNLLKRLIPMGYLGNTIPEADGGAGLDWVTFGLLMEVIEPVLYGVTMITGALARGIAVSGSEEQKKTYLPGLLSADRIGCSGITEPNVGSATYSIQTRAVEDGDHYIINGTKMWITNGPFADLCTVLATVDPGRGRDGICMLIVDKKVSPWVARPMEVMVDSTIPSVGELIFEDCRVPKENLLVPPGHGLKAQLSAFSAARCFVGLGSLITAQLAYEAAVKYARERTQWGKPIGRFQLIQNMIAEMYALIETSRLLIFRGLWMLDQGTRCIKESSLAKFYATEAAIKVTSMAIEVHGAYGLSKEYPVADLYKKGRMGTIPDGTNEIQRLVIGREILGLSAFV
ncbi:MAG: acyl-CoA dehydrogenase family protein [Proteobacteria bacterium]|nr:acyl-CoA dehydrogenase family protein [Pseudomonadota bacterium]